MSFSGLNIISFSGGLGSAMSALIAYEKGLNFELVFADTLIEDKDLYRFLRDVAETVGKPIHWLKDGRTPWDVFVDKRYMGNTRTAHCSSVLKTDMVRKWIKDQKFDKGSFRLVLGMDWSEQDRIERAKIRWDGICDVVSILNKYKVYRPTWAQMLDKYNLTIPRLYGLGFPHNNCGGMCVKAGLAQFNRLLTSMPEVFKFHEDEQERVMDLVPTMRPFLRRTKNKNMEYLTLKEFRTLVENNEINIPKFDDGGCGCFSDD